MKTQLTKMFNPTGNSREIFFTFPVLSLPQNSAQLIVSSSSSRRNTRTPLKLVIRQRPQESLSHQQFSGCGVSPPSPTCSLHPGRQLGWILWLCTDPELRKFLTTSQEFGWEEHLQNELFCFECDGKPWLNLLKWFNSAREQRGSSEHGYQMAESSSSGSKAGGTRHPSSEARSPLAPKWNF